MKTRIARAVLAACLCLTALTLSGCEDDPEDGNDIFNNDGPSQPAAVVDAGTP